MWTFIKRMVRHRWVDERSVHKLVPKDMLDRMTMRVGASERRHTGEIRICIEGGLPASYLHGKAPIKEITRARALMMFSKMRVWDTEQNNGVLIYLLVAERAIELIADRAVTRVVSPEDFQGMVSRMSAAFREGRFEDGLTQALEEVSAVLVQHFPVAEGQQHTNEQPDEPQVM